MLIRASASRMPDDDGEHHRDDRHLERDLEPVEEVDLVVPEQRPLVRREHQSTAARNCFVRGFEHVSKKPRGPDSTISPSSMKTLKSPISRAKFSSCVTITIVIPDSASLRMTASTSPTSSGSSAEVGSSNSITFGIEAERAGDRDALRLAAGELRRVVRRPVEQADLLQARAQRPLGLARGEILFAERSGRAMLSSAVRCGKRLNCWKTMPTCRRSCSGPPRFSLAAAEPRPVLDAEHADRSLARLLEQVDRAQQRRLARAGRAEDDDVLAGVDGEVDAVEHLLVAVRLPDPAQLDDGRPCRAGPHATPMVSSSRIGSSSGVRGRRSHSGWMCAS